MLYIKGFFTGEYNVISGKIKSKKDVLYTIQGKWDGRIDITNSKTKVITITFYHSSFFVINSKWIENRSFVGFKRCKESAQDHTTFGPTRGLGVTKVINYYSFIISSFFFTFFIPLFIVLEEIGVNR